MPRIPAAIDEIDYQTADNSIESKNGVVLKVPAEDHSLRPRFMLLKISLKDSCRPWRDRANRKRVVIHSLKTR